MTYRILLTNDDGIDAPGIAALFEEVSSLADVTIVAPTTERSGIGHAISVFNDLTLTGRKRNGKLWGYALEGTPADCVKFAIKNLMKKPPNLVLSGINHGQNTGNSILYSGTVAAAIEGTMYGFAAIAVSLAAWEGETPHFDYAARFSANLARLILEKGLPNGVLLNVNIPNIPENEIRGVVITRQGTSMFIDHFEHQGKRNGLSAFRNIGGKMLPSEEGEALDDLVLKQNKISITPLHYDLTHHELRVELDQWMRQDIMSEFLESGQLSPNSQTLSRPGQPD